MTAMIVILKAIIGITITKAAMLIATTKIVSISKANTLMILKKIKAYSQ